MTIKKNFTFSDQENLYFMQQAKENEKRSKDTSTKVGCVIVNQNTGEIISDGYNIFPRGVNQNIPERTERPLKYDFTEHAERNAIYAAAKEGVSTRNCILYVTLPPCVDCARAIIQSGIREVFYMPDLKHQNIPGWRDKLAISFQMFDEAGVSYKMINPEDLKNIQSKKKQQQTTDEIMKLFNNKELDRFSRNLIAVNGPAFESFICVEEINELVKELALNNSPDNIAEETADFIITRNHIVCAYDIKNRVETERIKKLFSCDDKKNIVALLDLQKSLTKYVNRNATTLTDLVQKIADADIAVANDIEDRQSLQKIKDNIDKKIQRTIKKVFTDKGIEYK